MSADLQKQILITKSALAMLTDIHDFKNRVSFPHSNRTGLAEAQLFGLLAGLLDETLQLFCPGRAALVSDVWLDWAGFLCGAAAVVLLRAVRARCARARRRQKEAQC